MQTQKSRQGGPKWEISESVISVQVYLEANKGRKRTVKCLLWSTGYAANLMIMLAIMPNSHSSSYCAACSGGWLGSTRGPKWEEWLLLVTTSLKNAHHRGA